MAENITTHTNNMKYIINKIVVVFYILNLFLLFCNIPLMLDYLMIF